MAKKKQAPLELESCKFCGCVYDWQRLRQSAIHDATAFPCPGCGAGQPVELEAPADPKSKEPPARVWKGDQGEDDDQDADL